MKLLLTPRAYLMLLGFTPLLALSTWIPFMWLVALVYLLMVLGAIIADVRATAKPADFVVSRSHDQRLSLGADNAVTVTIESLQRPAAALSVRDEYPDTFEASTQTLGEVQLEPRGQTTLRYTIRPPRRGNFRFGDTNLRWRGPFGLIRRQCRFNTAGDVRVYPNLLDIRRYELLAKRGRLSELGFRKVRLRGSGTEFERLRDYTTDDEYRRIDWNATARLSRPIVREYETEKSQNIVIMLDAGRLMRAPVGLTQKLDYTINAALMLTYVAAIRGDRVGLSVFTDTPVRYLTPRPGKAQFQRMLGVLYDIEGQPVESSYARAVADVLSRQKKRALVVMFTDIISGIGEDALVAQIGLLAPRHVPLVVTVSDPDVVALANAEVRDSTSLYERAVAEQVLDGRAITLQQLRSRGVRTLDVPADKLTVEVVNRYLALKQTGVV
jgi:uncharacterized protein (DUF58 family)